MLDFEINNFLIHLENVEICYLTQCPCQSHLATELINRSYSMSVERLFDLIFGVNDFLVAYRASRRIKGFINCSNLSFSIIFF